VATDPAELPVVGTDHDAGFGSVYSAVDAYYSKRITEFGPIPLGVDWTCLPTQQMRFVQLLKLCDFGSPFSLNDLGCGYGALIDYLDWRHDNAEIDYLGVDLSDTMIRAARDLRQDRRKISFEVGTRSPRVADYSVASGVFNIQVHESREVWESLVARTLEDLYGTSRLGFAVNFVTAGRGGTLDSHGLYGTDPPKWEDYCHSAFGAKTRVIDGYGLSEFTLLAWRREPGTLSARTGSGLLQ
jgi:SAM-dependent methyltransferase